MMLHSIIDQGGGVLVAIFGLSFGAWVLILWKCQQLWRIKEQSVDWADRAIEQLARGDRKAAADTCRRHQSTPIGKIMLAAVQVIEADRRTADQYLQPLFESEATQIHGSLRLIAMSAKTAPLLGLLGTVMGMIEVFTGFISSGELVHIDTLSLGISKALITTQAGLMVAVSILLMHGYLSSLADRYLGTVRFYMKKAERLIYDYTELKGTHGGV